MLNDLEYHFLLHAAYPKCMKNRERRLNANSKNKRGAYQKVYTGEELVFVKVLEDD